MQRGKLTAEVVYPESTILSEHTIVLIDKNITPAQLDLVDAFVAFLWSDTAQRIFVEYGFRSVNDSLNAANPSFGKIGRPFTVSDLGGWAAAKREIIEAVWKQTVLPETNP